LTFDTNTLIGQNHIDVRLNMCFKEDNLYVKVIKVDKIKSDQSMTILFLGP